MKRHALFVGVNDYTDKTFKPLRYSLSDATALSGAFAARGFDVEVLSNPQVDGVLDAVERSVSDLGPGDVFLFFFAGHGYTAQDNRHLLICSNDRFKYLRHNRAGIPVELLEDLTNDRGFNRAFLIDACRTDIFAGVAKRGDETRDLAVVSLPDAKENAGTCCVLRSCDKFCPAMEFADLGHGIFTQAVIDVLHEDSACIKPFGEDFVAGIRSRMRTILSDHHVAVRQNPCFQTNGEAFSLFGDRGIVPQTSPLPLPHSSMKADDGSKAKPQPKIPDSVVTHELSVSNWTVKMDVDLPGCGEKQLMFTLFETLSRYLCLLQGLGKHGEGDAATAFGSESFRDSAWRLVSGPNKSAMVKFPVLTEEDERAIANAGGMEELSRQKGAWPIFRELVVELNVLCEDLRRNCKGNQSVGNALALAEELSKSLKNQGEV